MLDNNVYTFYFLKYYRITLYRYFRRGLDKSTLSLGNFNSNHSRSGSEFLSND